MREKALPIEHLCAPDISRRDDVHPLCGSLSLEMPRKDGLDLLTAVEPGIGIFEFKKWGAVKKSGNLQDASHGQGEVTVCRFVDAVGGSKIGMRAVGMSATRLLVSVLEIACKGLKLE